jgi:hypothetical protein
MPFGTFLVTRWLNLMTHLLVCPILCKLGALAQMVAFGNQVKCLGCCEWFQQAPTIHSNTNLIVETTMSIKSEI